MGLLVMDGIRTQYELNRLPDRVIICSMIMVTVGLIQFFFTFDLAQYMRLPGLVLNTDDTFILNSRSNFNRPGGTSLHTIEFGVVCAALIPPAYLFPRRHKSFLSSVPVFALAFGAMVSLSRSAVLAAAVALIVLLLSLLWRERVTIVVTATAMVLTSGVLVNGLIGTIRSLFTSADTDPSVQARIEQTPRVLKLIAEHPYISHGLGTFSIENDFLLDNEIQGTGDSDGLVGAAILIGFVVVVIVGSHVRAGGELDRLTGKVLAATIAGLFISAYTFDAFFYHILTGIICSSASDSLEHCIGSAAQMPVGPILKGTRPASGPGRTTWGARTMIRCSERWRSLLGLFRSVAGVSDVDRESNSDELLSHRASFVGPRQALPAEVAGFPNELKQPTLDHIALGSLVLCLFSAGRAAHVGCGCGRLGHADQFVPERQRVV